MTPTHRYISVNWEPKTYIRQLCADTEYRQEDLPKLMPNMDRRWESV